MIILKTKSHIDGIRKSCQIVAYVLKELKKEIKPGITTKYLNDMAEDLCFQKGAVPGFKGYRGFPYSICSSRNAEIVHGFPSDLPLREGEILSIDFGALYKGWYGDSAFTAPVGKVSPEIRKLLAVGRGCLYAGIEAAKPYCKIGDISYAVQTYAEKRKFNVVREFVGHGIGKDLHEEPQVPNWGSKGSGYMLKPGSVIAIEPMVSAGTCEIKVMPDNWTAVTVDGMPSVHFEHTIAITENGTEILTKRD
jgi:methionyl aminopeptidase